MAHLSAHLSAGAPLRFGCFELDPISGELRRRGLKVRLTPQARALLCMLLEEPVRTRNREEIQQCLWPSNTFVNFERSVNKVVHSLREALGETARRPHFIETVPTGGYRFASEFIEPVAAANHEHPQEGIQRLAVLPIISGARPGVIVLARRIGSCLIEKFASVPGLRVIAETTMKGHKLEGLGPEEAGRILGAQAVLSGEFARHGKEFHLAVELIDSADGALLCRARAARSSQLIVDCEQELAQEVLNQIYPQLKKLQLSRDQEVA